MRDIARAAGFSIGGVYQFVGTKDDLYLAIIEQQWAQFFTCVKAALQARGFAGRLTALTSGWLAFLEARRGFFQIYLSDRNRFTGTFKDRISTTVERNQARLRQLVTQLMQAGIDERLVRFEDAEFLASSYIGILHHQCILNALSSDSTPPPRAEDVISLFLAGAEAPSAAAALATQEAGRTFHARSAGPHSEDSDPRVPVPQKAIRRPLPARRPIRGSQVPRRLTRKARPRRKGRP